MLKQYIFHNMPGLLQDYVYRFAPLVLEECGALMLRGNEDGIQSESFQAVCISHKSVSPDSTSLFSNTYYNNSQAYLYLDSMGLWNTRGSDQQLQGGWGNEIPTAGRWPAAVSNQHDTFSLCVQKGEFLLARLAVPSFVGDSLRENDAVLLSKKDPNVSYSWIFQTYHARAIDGPCYLHCPANTRVLLLAL